MHNIRYTLGLLKKTLSQVQIKDFFDKFFIYFKSVNHLVTAI